MRNIASRKANRNGQRGFSLLEMLVYVSLVAVLALFLSGTIVTLLKSRGATESQSDVHDSLRFAEEKITQDIRSATTLTTPGTAGTTATTLVMTVAGSTITYDVSGGVLRRQVNASAPVNVTSTGISVTSANFTRFENTNPSLAKTVVSIQAALVFANGSTSPDKQYSETKQFTATMP
jgi:prepilin-type N-terminal cleavage/methylation domain-containing protein